MTVVATLKHEKHEKFDTQIKNKNSKTVENTNFD